MGLGSMLMTPIDWVADAPKNLAREIGPTMSEIKEDTAFRAMDIFSLPKDLIGSGYNKSR